MDASSAKGHDPAGGPLPLLTEKNTTTSNNTKQNTFLNKQKIHTLRTHTHLTEPAHIFVGSLTLSSSPSRVHISDAGAQNFYEIDFSKQFKVRTHCTLHGAKTTGLLPTYCPYVVSLPTVPIYVCL